MRTLLLTLILLTGCYRIVEEPLYPCPPGDDMNDNRGDALHSGLGRTFFVAGNSAEQLALAWRAPDKAEHDVQLEMSPTWVVQAQAIGGTQVRTPSLSSPLDAGRTVVARIRWSTGMVTRDSTLEGLGAIVPLLTTAPLSARGALWSLRASQIDVFVSSVTAMNTTVLASLAVANTRMAFNKPQRTYQPGLSFVAGPNQIFVFDLPAYSEMVRVAGPDPLALVRFFAPDGTTIIQTTNVGALVDFNPIPSAATAMTVATLTTTDDYVAEYR